LDFPSDFLLVNNDLIAENHVILHLIVYSLYSPRSIAIHRLIGTFIAVPVEVTAISTANSVSTVGTGARHFYRYYYGSKKYG
jgi:hypothetical protein